MNLENKYKSLVSAYYGIMLMDEYDLKVYVLKDIENYINNFININPIDNFNFKQEFTKYERELSDKVKLQDALQLMQEMDQPLELLLLIKNKIRQLDKQEMKRSFDNNL